MNLTSNDLGLVLSRLPRDVFKLIQDRGLFLAGGFIRATIAGEKVNDIDLFGGSEAHLKMCSSLLESVRKDSRLIKTGNASTLLCSGRTPIQFIHRWVYDHHEPLVNSFDFTIAQAVIWWDAKDKKWRSIAAPTFYSDLAGKRLVYNCPQRNEDAGGSMLRVRKFLRYGYRIDAVNLAKVMARLFMSVMDDITDEERAAKVLGGLLLEVDPLTVIDGIEVGEE